MSATGANLSGIATILKKSAALSIPQITSRLLALLLIPLYTRLLSPADFGVLELLDLTLYFFTALCGAQLSNAIAYFHTQVGSPNQERVFSTALVCGVVIGVVTASTGWLLSAHISRVVLHSSEFARPLQLYFAAFAFGPLIESGMIILRIRDQIALFNLAAISRNLVQAALNVILLTFFGMGYMSFVWSSLLASAVMGSLFLAAFYRRSPFVVDASLFKGILRYSLPLGFGAFAMLIVHYGDRFFLQRYVSLSEVGVYSLAYKIGMLAYMIYGPFSSYWSVERFRVIDGKLGDGYYARVFTYLIVILSATVLFISAFARPALELLVPPAYHGAAQFAPWIALAYVLRALGEHLRGVLMVKARTLIDTRISLVGGALCLACYAVLIPGNGAAGATASTVIAFAALAFYSLVEAQRVRHYQFEVRRIVLVLLAAAAAILPLLFIGRLNPWLQVLGGLGAFFVFPMLLSFLGFLESSERQAFRLLFRRIFNLTQPAQ